MVIPHLIWIHPFSAENIQKNPILHKVLPEKGGHDFIWDISAKSDDVSNVGQLSTFFSIISLSYTYISDGTWILWPSVC